MVSIVIPSYNVEPYIARCLDSALRQSHTDIEIVVVDDASTDGSVSVVQKYQRRHTNIRLLRHDCNRGLMATRRDGYMAAKGCFVMFLDSDDALPDNAVQTLVERQRQTGADIVMGDLLKMYADGREQRVAGSLSHDATKTKFMSALLTGDITHSLCGKLFRAGLIKDGHLQTFDNLTIAEDGCLLYQLVAKAERIVSQNGIAYLYYENKASSSQHAYGAKQIDNLMTAYGVMASAFRPYKELHELLERRLTKVAFTFYFERVPLHTVRQLLHKHKMTDYGGLKHALKYLGWKDYWFFAKRFVYVRTMLSND